MKERLWRAWESAKEIMNVGVQFLARVLAYPVHFTVRILARLLLLIAATSAIPLAALIVLVFQGSLLSISLLLLDYLAGREATQYTLQFLGIGSGSDDWNITRLVSTTFGALATFGLFGALLPPFRRQAIEALVRIRAKTRSIVTGKWIPGLEVDTSLTISWNDGFAKVWSCFRPSLTHSLVLSLFLTRVLVYPIHFVVRMLARFLLLFAAASSLPLSALIVFVFLSSLTSILLILLDCFADLEAVQYALQLMGVDPGDSDWSVIGLVGKILGVLLFIGLARRFKSDIKEVLSHIRQETLCIARGQWIPGLRISTSLVDSWSDGFANLWPSFRPGLTHSPTLSLFLTRLLVYPIHLAVRILARLLLLAAVPLAMLTAALIVLWLPYSPTPMLLLDDVANMEVVRSTLLCMGCDLKNSDCNTGKLAGKIFGALAALGLVGGLAQHFLSSIKKTISDIKNRISSNFTSEWISEFEIGASLVRSLKYGFVEFWSTFLWTLAASWKLFLIVFFAGLLAYLSASSAEQVTEPIHDITNSNRVENYYFLNPNSQSFDSLKAVLLDFKSQLTEEIQRQSRNTYVFNPGVFAVEPDNTDGPARPDEISTRIEFPKETTFSLVYPPQGNLETGEGICPSEWQMRWLDLFKRAAKRCSGEGSLRVSVKGLASIAPVLRMGELSIHDSNSSNCKIANRRAVAIAHYLTSATSGSEHTNGVEQCMKKLEQYSGFANTCQVHPSASTLGTDGAHFTESTIRGDEGNEIEVVAKLWLTHGGMEDNKLVDDGTLLPIERRVRHMEIFNRSVQIELGHAMCWRDGTVPVPILARIALPDSTEPSGDHR